MPLPSALASVMISGTTRAPAALPAKQPAKLVREAWD